MEAAIQARLRVPAAEPNYQRRSVGFNNIEGKYIFTHVQVVLINLKIKNQEAGENFFFFFFLFLKAGGTCKWKRCWSSSGVLMADIAQQTRSRTFP